MKKYNVDADGFIIDADGNRVLGKDGLPMWPEDLMVSSEGDSLKDSEGEGDDEGSGNESLGLPRWKKSKKKRKNFLEPSSA